MPHQPAEVNPILPADRLPDGSPGVSRGAEILAPLSKILWGDESLHPADQSGSARLALDLGTGFVSDNLELLSLAWALSH